VSQESGFQFVYEVENSGLFNICFQNKDSEDKTLSFDFVD
jgi:hypothetical protein